MGAAFGVEAGKLRQRAAQLTVVDQLGADKRLDRHDTCVQRPADLAHALDQREPALRPFAALF